jgi:hypothetical protein
MPRTLLAFMLVVLGSGLIGCSRQSSIAGKYEDRNWQTAGRVDTWVFGQGTWSHETRYENAGPSSLQSGAYTLQDDRLTLTTKHVTRYRSAGKRDEDLDISETIKIAHEGDKLVLDVENKTVEGKTVLSPVE